MKMSPVLFFEEGEGKFGHPELEERTKSLKNGGQQDPDHQVRDRSNNRQGSQETGIDQERKGGSILTCQGFTTMYCSRGRGALDGF